jgi:ribosomal protein L7/L12
MDDHAGRLENGMSEVAALARKGEKIPAIKRLRELTGMPLKEAKDLVEAMAVGENVTFTTTTSDFEVGPEVMEAIQAGHTIEAIRRLRLATGADLKTAKEMVEAVGRAIRGLPSDPARTSFEWRTETTVKSTSFETPFPPHASAVASAEPIQVGTPGGGQVGIDPGARGSFSSPPPPSTEHGGRGPDPFSSPPADVRPMPLGGPSSPRGGIPIVGAEKSPLSRILALAALAIAAILVAHGMGWM